MSCAIDAEEREGQRRKRKASAGPTNHQWARYWEVGSPDEVHPSTFDSRIRRGWDFERAINTPPRAYTQRRRACAAAAAAAPAYSVILVTIGEKKIEVIKEVRAITGLSLKESMHLVEAAPMSIRQGVTKAEAETIRAQLEKAGAVVGIVAGHGK
jgi:ribosomal protein L7/L12